MLLYTRRQALSRFLAQGMSVEEIAERMRKTPGQIQEWIDEIPPGWSKR